MERVLVTDSDQFSAISRALAILLLAFALALFAIAGPKPALAAVGAAAFLVAAFSLPLRTSLKIFFLYLFLDGALKILSNYNPVLHVGQDIFLLSILLRVFSSAEFRWQQWVKTPFFLLFLLFVSSVLVQYVNPFGLGLLPSLAGTKVYLSGILLFFLLYHGLRNSEIKGLCIWIVILGTMQGMIALTEYFLFPEAIFQLHPKYAQIAGEKFVGNFYRPFGTTTSPGAPSVWIFLCTPFALHLLLFGKHWRPRFLSLAFFAVGIPTLLVCQTRSAMVLTALMMAAFFCAPAGRRWLRFGGLCLLIGFGALHLGPGLHQGSLESSLLDLGVDPLKAEQVNRRLVTLLDPVTYVTSRRGATAKMLELAEITPFGIGLSRVGAASAVWKERIAKDKEFGKAWAFADNVYRAIFTELGVFGLLSWLLLVVSISVFLVRKSVKSKVQGRRAFLWICGTIPLVLLAGGLGSEGILYMPVSAFMWASLAMGCKESVYV